MQNLTKKTTRVVSYKLTNKHLIDTLRFLVTYKHAHTCTDIHMCMHMHTNTCVDIYTGQ